MFSSCVNQLSQQQQQQKELSIKVNSFSLSISISTLFPRNFTIMMQLSELHEKSRFDNSNQLK